jgi:hypothetical protein
MRRDTILLAERTIDRGKIANFLNTLGCCTQGVLSGIDVTDYRLRHQGCR